jgi:hypothetical protein
MTGTIDETGTNPAQAGDMPTPRTPFIANHLDRLCDTLVRISSNEFSPRIKSGQYFRLSADVEPVLGDIVAVSYHHNSSGFIMATYIPGNAFLAVAVAVYEEKPLRPGLQSNNSAMDEHKQSFSASSALDASGTVVPLRVRSKIPDSVRKDLEHILSLLHGVGPRIGDIKWCPAISGARCTGILAGVRLARNGYF